MEIKTDKGTYLPNPAMINPLPAANGSFIDGLSGVKITRLTDERDGPSFSTTYAIWPTANRDNTRLWIYGLGTNTFYTSEFDPVTGTIPRPDANKSPLKAIVQVPAQQFANYESALWSGVDADKVFFFVDAKLFYYKPSTGTNILVKDLTPLLGAGYSFRQQHKSRDDKRFAASGPQGFMVYDVELDRVLLDVRTTDMNGIALDKSGKWLLYVPDDDNTEYIYNVETGAREQITSDPRTGLPDFTIGHCDVGTDLIAGNDRWRGAISLRKLSAPHIAPAAFTYAPYWIAHHLSMTADDENWALLSTYMDVTGPDPNRFKNECFQIGLQGADAGKVRRLFHHRARTDDPDFGKRYWSTPRANVSRDGRFVFFTSNMGGLRNDLWVADLGATTASPAPTPAPVPAPTPTPSPTPPPPPSTSIPVVTITSPVAGATLKGQITVTATVTDSGTIKEVYLNVDGQTTGPKTAAPYSFALDTTRLDDGSHSIQVRAWNTGGQAGDSLKINVTVANAAPIPAPPPVPPTPVPIPPIPNTRTINNYPKQPSKRNPIIEAQWRERYRLKSESDTTATFEKVS